MPESLKIGLDFDDFLYDTNLWVCEVIARLTGQDRDELAQLGYLSGPGKIRIELFQQAFQGLEIPKTAIDSDGLVCGRFLTNSILFGMLLNGNFHAASRELGVREYRPFKGSCEGVEFLCKELREWTGQEVEPLIVTSRAPLPEHVSTVQYLLKRDWLGLINFREAELVGNGADVYEQICTKQELAAYLGLLALFDDAEKYLEDLGEATVGVKFTKYPWQKPEEPHSLEFDDWSDCNQLAAVRNGLVAHYHQLTLAA